MAAFVSVDAQTIAAPVQFVGLENSAKSVSSFRSKSSGVNGIGNVRRISMIRMK